MSHAGAKQHDPLVGTTIAGRYSIEGSIGAGAMGAVYRAKQVGLGRAVALKVLRRDVAWGGDTVQRFRREAKAMSALHHPNTVHVFDFGATDDGLLYLAMELLEGELVTEQLARCGALGLRQAVQHAQEVLHSIGEAHAKGIVHRDLKPDNIFLSRVEGQSEPMVKVLDFGIAKAIEGERKIDQFETLDGTVFGTPRYMSPEQAAGKPLDARTDLYSVGTLLYEFLTGHPPFVDVDAVVVMAKHIRETPVPLRRSAPDRLIPASLEAVVAKALEKSPSDRFQSAEEFEKALSGCLPDITLSDRLSIAGAAKTPIGRLLVAPRRTRVFAAAVLGGLLLALGVGLWLSRRDAAVPTASSPVQVVVPGSSTNEVAGGPAGATIAPAASARATVIVTLQSEPPGAEVSRDGTQLGVTPLEVVMRQGEPASVSLHMAGFVDHTIELRATEPTRLVTLNALPPPARGPAKARAVPIRRPKRPVRPGAANTGDGKSTASTPITPGSPYEKF